MTTSRGRLRHAADRLRHDARAHAIRAYRATCLRRTTVIGVTGSGGKTTAKELIAAILKRRLRVRASVANYNAFWHLSDVVLRTRPWDDACVLEFSAGPKGAFPELLRVARPDIAVVTSIGTDHYSMYQSPEAVAQVKGQLVEAIGPAGTAVLNLDDAHVAAMASRCAGRVVTYGQHEDATYRAIEVRGTWPDPMQVVVANRGRHIVVQTGLFGRHWLPSVLASVAVADVMGIPPEESAEVIASVYPTPGRMSPVVVADEITVLRDDQKAPAWSLPLFFEYVREAKASRKIVVLGTLSDYGGDGRGLYIQTTRNALAAADVVIGVGPQSTRYLRAREASDRDRLLVFSQVFEARRHLQQLAEPGDLIAVKGSYADQLGDIVERWEADAAPVDVVREPPSVPPTAAFAGTVVVGLGNPGPARRATPHNVGYAVVEHLARSAGQSWSDSDGSSVAHLKHGEQDVLLVKLESPVNHSGTQLARLAAARGFVPEQCLIVFDDLMLPPGTVRFREYGSSGGHNGVHSILQAFQTDRIQRVKVGVGGPPEGTTAVDFVLSPFDEERRALLESAIAPAADKVWWAIGRRAKPVRPRR